MKTTRSQTLIAAALISVLTLLGAVAPAHAANTKPNILLIVADDMSSNI